jgi:chemotaxis protein methyltransferase CheR
VVPSSENWHISILGTDINRNVLACAKEATYGEKHIGHLPKEYLAKYFKVRGPTYILNTNVRECARFEYHNLAKDPFIDERMQNLDLIFCRNVMIYFDSQTSLRVIENFYNCLAREGYLFLGHSETLWQITDKFERVEFPQTFIYKKRLYPVQEGTMKPFIAVPEIAVEDLTLSATLAPILFQHGSGSGLGADAGNRWPGSTLSDAFSPGWACEGSTSTKETDLQKSTDHQELRFDLQGELDPLEDFERPADVKEKAESAEKEATLGLKETKDRTALPSPPHRIEQSKNNIRAHLTRATLLANEAKYQEATDILGKIIEADNLSVEAYYLLGVLSYKNSNLNEAETQFRKVIYVDPDSVIAYFNLGNMYLYQKKYREAAREFRNAVRLLEKRPRDEHVRFCEDFTVEFLLRACRNSLVEISKRGE